MARASLSTRRKLIGHSIDAGHTQGLIDGHARQDAGDGTRQQGLAGTWRPDQHYGQQTVAFPLTLADVLFFGVRDKAKINR